MMALLRRFVTRNDVKLFQPTQSQTKRKNLRGIKKKILQQNIVELLELKIHQWLDDKNGSSNLDFSRPSETRIYSLQK